MNSSAIAPVKSSPPKRLSPAIETISTTLSNNSTTEMSRVPPPKSTTIKESSSISLSNFLASAAADGSLIMRSMLIPANFPASFVA